MLSGRRPSTIAERLASLGAVADVDATPDFYGVGGPVTALEERVADLLGAREAVFFPTGTMAQQVALRYGAELTGRTAVALHPSSHPVVHERNAYTQLSGLRAVWSTDRPRNPTAAEIARLPEPVGTVALELPMREAGFVLPTWPQLVEVAEAARARGARVHFDGARLWESTPWLEHDLAEIAALADSTYVSFYKTLGGVSGAALVGSGELAPYARAWRHRYGGNLFQQWPAALAALHGLDVVLPRLANLVTHARVVADALAGVPGARVTPEPVHTHQFQLWLPFPAAVLDEAALTLAERESVWFVGGWRDTVVPGMAMAEVTVAEPALEVTAAEVGHLAERFLSRVDEVLTT